MLDLKENATGVVFSKFYEIVKDTIEFLPEHRTKSSDGEYNYIPFSTVNVLEIGKVIKSYDSERKIRILMVGTEYGNIMVHDKFPDQHLKASLSLKYKRTSKPLFYMFGKISLVGARDIFKIFGNNYDLSDNVGYNLLKMKKEFSN